MLAKVWWLPVGTLHGSGIKQNVLTKSKILQRLLTVDWLDRYIRISTPEVYGANDKVLNENTPYNPSTPYAISHTAVDQHLLAYQRAKDFPAIIGRFATFMAKLSNFIE